ncbi:hypothetical protein GNP61_19485 [Aliivibrio fischeri]|uniref:hypothetical protein n=1 Tax=Aliivibrio fischeri TaxID=668 RepID=UPI0012DAA9F2|nr:hypothetical protein [Aliivibrio fischeri]MUK43730.1 hypothetical protein [Aliivibrio fischeri]
MGDKYVAVATIGASLLAGLISLVNLTVSKEHKISELRQTWISELRNDTSLLVAMCNNLSARYMIQINLGPINYWQFFSEHMDLLQKIDELHHRIKMHLNPHEHKKLIALLEDIESSITDAQRLGDCGQMAYLFEELNDNTQAVLKAEWERVKTGEPGFNRLKKIGLTITLISIFGLFMFFSMA